MTKPLISIIIPAYNVERYLERCLQSVVEQEYTNWEVILIEDGSTDGTRNVCQQWAERESRIRLIEQENRGLSVARNRGMEKARGEFFFFLDSDDWIEKETLLNLINVQCDTMADVVCCGFEKVYEDGRKETFTSEKSFLANAAEAVEEMMTQRNVCSVAWNKLYRRSLWDDVRFPEGKVHEDEFVTYRILYKASHVAYIGNPHYQYFQRKNGIMGRMSYDGEMQMLEALEERTAWLEVQKERRLMAISLCHYLHYIKYLYRNNKKNISEENYKDLRKRYRKGVQRAVSNPYFSLWEKGKVIAWMMILFR